MNKWPTASQRSLLTWNKIPRWSLFCDDPKALMSGFGLFLSFSFSFLLMVPNIYSYCPVVIWLYPQGYEFCKISLSPDPDDIMEKKGEYLDSGSFYNFPPNCSSQERHTTAWALTLVTGVNRYHSFCCYIFSDLERSRDMLPHVPCWLWKDILWFLIQEISSSTFQQSRRH